MGRSAYLSDFRALSESQRGRLLAWPAMLFRQFVDEDLGCASYLVGDADAGEALLVDPAYAIEQYLEEAERTGVRITRVLETHTHADHVSGHGRLALEHGIPVSIHAAAEAEYPHEPLADGDELSVGSVTVRCLHTPGHRPEHCCFLAETRAVDGRLAVLRLDRAAGPRRRGARGRRGALPQPAPAARAAGRRAGLPRPRRRLALRRRDAGRSLLDDRRRAPRQRAARARDGLRVRRRGDGHSHAAAAEHGADRGSEPRPVPRGVAAAASRSPTRTAPPCSTCGAPMPTPRATSAAP